MRVILCFTHSSGAQMREKTPQSAHYTLPQPPRPAPGVPPPEMAVFGVTLGKYYHQRAGPDMKFGRHGMP